ncbi:PGDYG domain-containing protein [Micromonospora chalcea]|uniref:PGDYG domain-containing protein n=1 Tax=Micromonospora chalcea TaxID=1874 RepID=UPI003D725974
MPYETWRKKPVDVQAAQWWRNGDHPEDGVGELAPDPAGGEYRRVEGAVVGFFRHPGYPGDETHERCGRTWHEHGWIDTLEGGHRVCPGDWIVTGVQGERWPVKPDIFRATYEPVGERAA